VSQLAAVVADNSISYARHRKLYLPMPGIGNSVFHGGHGKLPGGGNYNQGWNMNWNKQAGEGQDRCAECGCYLAKGSKSILCPLCQKQQGRPGKQ
jgi:hypothetical protein